MRVFPKLIRMFYSSYIYSLYIKRKTSSKRCICEPFFLIFCLRYDCAAFRFPRYITSVSIPVDFAFILEGMWGVCLQFNERFWNFSWRIKWYSIFLKFRRLENVVVPPLRFAPLSVRNRKLDMFKYYLYILLIKSSNFKRSRETKL